MFLHLSVILFTGVCVSQHALGQTPPWADISQHALGQTLPPLQADGYCCGWYTSYWNSFLLPPANKVCEGYVFTGVCLSTPGGACVVLFGGMRGFIWGACMVLFGGACVVLFGGHAWFYSGGVRGFFSFFGYNEIRSMRGRYASYWNAFLLKL